MYHYCSRCCASCQTSVQLNCLRSARHILLCFYCLMRYVNVFKLLYFNLCVLCALCLKKVPTIKLSVTLSNVNQFSKFVHCWKAYKICCKTHTTLPTLGMQLHYVGKLKCKFSAYIQRIWKKMHTSNIFIASTFVIHPNFQCLKQRVFSILIANKIFHVTVLLFVYFCDKFVAPEIGHSRRHCSVCQQSTWYSSVMSTRF